MKMLWTICCVCMICFFSLAAYVQINDPDGPLWMAIYGLPAVLTFLQVSFFKFKSHWMISRLMWLHTAVCFLGALYISYGLLITKDTSNYGNLRWYEKEEGREMGGLVFVVLWLMLCQFHDRSMSGAWLSAFCIPVVVSPVCLWLYTYYDEAYREKLPDHCKQAL
ncbi:transmembrane protein 220-like [Amphiura filiformis]|uniref:transmembrane protein 220-like n=1 Tax=Amphiura filiformis TaxID=82378 RepID=UPI003B2184FA